MFATTAHDIDAASFQMHMYWRCWVLPVIFAVSWAVLGALDNQLVVCPVRLFDCSALKQKL